jgi:hypothetical protein
MRQIFELGEYERDQLAGIAEGASAGRVRLQFAVDENVLMVKLGEGVWFPIARSA